MESVYGGLLSAPRNPPPMRGPLPLQQEWAEWTAPPTPVTPPAPPQRPQLSAAAGRGAL